MIVRDDEIGHVGQIDLELGDIAKHCLGPRTRIDQQLVTIGFDECRKTPLADALAGVSGQHGGQHGDLQRLDLGTRRRLALSRPRGGQQEDGERSAQRDSCHRDLAWVSSCH